MKLEFEMVPDSCWYSNLRSLLSPEQWDVVRKEAYARAKGICNICGGVSHKLEAHEQWEYDEKNSVQKLKNVIAVCKSCHEVIHGRRGACKQAFYESQRLHLRRISKSFG